MAKIMTKEQAEETIKILVAQAKEFKVNGSPQAAAQNERVVKRLKNRIKSGKYQ